MRSEAEAAESKDLRREGIKFGLWVGLLFAIVEIIGAAVMTAPSLNPFRAAASTILGQRALTATPFVIAFIVGVVVHFALSAIYGLAYASLVVDRLTAGTRASLSREIAIGLFCGLLLYLLNFQVLARAIYPWFLQANQSWQLVVHTLFFGLPLAGAFAWAERRTPHQHLAHATPPTPRLRRRRHGGHR